MKRLGLGVSKVDWTTTFDFAVKCGQRESRTGRMTSCLALTVLYVPSSLESVISHTTTWAVRIVNEAYDCPVRADFARQRDP